MAGAEDRLRQSVDEVLEPAWHRERRRAWRRVLSGSFGRWLGGMAAISLLALALRLILGMALPWFFFVGMGLLGAIGALPDPSDHTHLRR